MTRKLNYTSSAGRKAGAAICSALGVVAVATAALAASSCDMTPVRYRGFNGTGTGYSTKPFMMVSAYNLEPYRKSYLSSVLSALGRDSVPGIVYSGAGAVSKRLAKNCPAPCAYPTNEVAYNELIYKEATQKGVPLVLQVQAYANDLEIPGQGKRNVSASELIDAKTNLYRLAFRDEVKAEVAKYTQYYPGGSCAVIFDEESGIYHSAIGGGTFWSYPQPVTSEITQYYDELFAERWARLFYLFRSYVKSVDSQCTVGAHLGHSVFYNEPVLTKWINWLGARYAKPDFIFYDFYLAGQASASKYYSKLWQRNEIARRLGIPMLHLAQNHTMGHFMSGAGKTLSRGELDSTIDYSAALGFTYLGLYGKNGHVTEVLDPPPFIPNTVTNATVYESSMDRWTYGLQRLESLSSSWRYPDRFDLVLYGRLGFGNYEVLAKNQQTGVYESLAIINANIRPNYASPEINTIRYLQRERYLAEDQRLDLKINALNTSFPGYLERAFIARTEPYTSFRTSAALRTDAASKVPSYAVAYDDGLRYLSGSPEFPLCVYQ